MVGQELCVLKSLVVAEQSSLPVLGNALLRTAVRNMRVLPTGLGRCVICVWYRERKEVNYLNLLEDTRERGTLRE